jgi:3-hydroxymyristoyl/3-hydroxydecanoyl-(acyl carrier protein) dehydratase
MPGAVLQNFAYELSADGEVFYRGESLFGYFDDDALANQVGLDHGTYLAPWLDRTAGVTAHRLDLRADRRLFDGPGLRLGRDELQLVDRLEVVPGGGDHGAGYVRGHRQITPDDWYFDCHFHRDPVMPGSLGIEAVIQAMQAYVIDQDLAADFARPTFALPAGVEMAWRYRGQILRDDRDMHFDVHVKEIRREPDRLLVIGDANLWKTGMRIYELKDVAVEVRPGGEEDR